MTLVLVGFVSFRYTDWRYKMTPTDTKTNPPHSHARLDDMIFSKLYRNSKVIRDFIVRSI